MSTGGSFSITISAVNQLAKQPAPTKLIIMQEVPRVNIEIVNKLKEQIAQLVNQVQTMQLLKGIKIADAKVFKDKHSTLRRYLTLIDMHI